MSDEDRPKIPSDMRRNVRRRCHFGCVVCGSPVYDYHHMAPWAEVKEHTEDNLTLLCDKHHDAATRGSLPERVVRRHDGAPANSASPLTAESTRLHFDETPEWQLGAGLTISNTENAIRIEDRFRAGSRMEDGYCLVNIEFRDESGESIFVVEDGELRHRTNGWDVTYVGTTLTIHQKFRRFAVVIEFLPESNLIKIKDLLLAEVQRGVSHRVTGKDGATHMGPVKSYVAPVRSQREVIRAALIREGFDPDRILP